MKNAIILNKQFSGEWLNNENNIAHEIIDFLLTDDNQYYVYNIPYGVCPSNIWVDGSDENLKTNKEKYIAKYLILADKFIDNTLDIKYVIELKEKLHNLHISKNKKNKLENVRKNIKLIEDLNIKYGGKYIYEAFNYETDGTQIHVTFKGKKIYQTNDNLKIKLKDYNFQRNKGYIYQDEHKEDYRRIINKIESFIKNEKLVELKLEKVEPNMNFYSNNKTFIDFCMSNDNEQVFTNILFNILSYKDIFKHFCNHFIKGKINNININNDIFQVEREKKISGGRIDLYASSNKYHVIIENKIHSGLNGIKKFDTCSQLKTYYQYIYKKTEKEPICFIATPNYKIEQIKMEIKKYDPKMIDIFNILPYKELSLFIKKMVDNNILDKNFSYYKYVNDVIDSLNKHSYTLKETYSLMFYNALNK